MSKLMWPGQSRLAIQVCAASAVAALLSGCSSDSTRLSDPFGNPFSTASTAKPQHVAARKTSGTGHPAAVVATALPPRPTTVASAAPVAPRMAPASSETTGSIGPAHAVAGASFGGWSSNGGAPIVVAQGESADMLAKRYGVPQNALLQVNGLRSAADLQPGARIVVPVYSATASAQPAAPNSPKLAAVRPALAHPVSAPPTKVARAVAPAPVAAQEPVPTKSTKVAAAAAKAAVSRIAKAEPARAAVEPHAKAPAPARVAASAPRLVKGSAPLKTAALEAAPKTKAAPARLAALAHPEKIAPASQPVKTAAAKPVPTKVAVVKPAAAPAKLAATATTAKAPKPEKVAEAVSPKAVDPTPTATVVPVAAAAEAGSAAGGPEFRWPARGRIIQGFKGGTGGNDGINIAVPEGTAVKAAEGGVVAYAGSELKGYGNLVLIRHPNGFVSAYANNGEIDVKRGDSVKRGQTIAKSGQSGNVASPQLHFELRKGSQPVDPTSYLAGL